ncbi:hypothetical protein NB539_20085 [Vibrio parahaemolyticus]|uniref:hypothetical protein n=1 Tax=Vibrio parahaemolyticus TaxID=670 RepID=UPI0006B2A97F|nr:hypothetical protein [Vibrio parahaemolyticus]MCR9838663.1 hypothetical protein [Vibrio parahaemolyticus]MCS0034427.1 hypothetical protein [Vibrio parahaemolyticus]
MSRKTKRTRARDKRFFEALEKQATIGEAAKIAGYSRRSVYDYAADDPAFAQQLNDAQLDIVEKLEKEADRRAMEGVTDFKSLKVSKDGYKVIPFVKYSDSLLMFRLKALAPEKYRDNYKPPELPDDLDDVSIEDITEELGKTLKAFMNVEDIVDDDATEDDA